MIFLEGKLIRGSPLKISKVTFYTFRVLVYNRVQHHQGEQSEAQFS